MVSFRYHVVSIVGVFLALALGIAMGVTVIDKATVDYMQKRLNDVSSQVQAANQRSDGLQSNIQRDAGYESRAEDYLVADKLDRVPVSLIGFSGIDQGPVGDMKRTLAKSGALIGGTIWITEKMKLDNPADVAKLSGDLGAQSSDPSQLRQLLVARLSAVMAGSAQSAVLKPLIDDGFLTWEGDAGGGDITKIPFGQSRMIVVSGYNSGVPNDQLAIPLVKSLAATPTRRVVAAESGKDPDARTSGERAVFLGPIISDNTLNTRLSTVDNIEVSAGRVAVALGLAQLPSGLTGHYGYANSAEGPIPPIPPIPK